MNVFVDIRMLTKDDLMGRPMVDLCVMRLLHFRGLFEGDLSQENLERLDDVIRFRIGYILKEFGSSLPVLSQELDDMARVVPHYRRGGYCSWFSVFDAYRNLLVAIVIARKEVIELDNVVSSRKSIVRRGGYLLVGEE